MNWSRQRCLARPLLGPPDGVYKLTVATRVPALLRYRSSRL